MERKIPDFLIVGGMKAGTTTLAHHLSHHQEVHIPRNELHFFNSETNFSKGLEWYKLELLRNRKETAKLFGEKTPTYSFQPNVAERIYRLYPDVKLIWIFRDPVERTYSNYLHVLKNGGENLSFRDAIRLEDSRIKKYLFHGYKLRSIYCQQVARFLQYFPRNQMYFLLFEDLIKPYGPAHALHGLFDFLNIDRNRFEFVSEQKNPTLMPRFTNLLFFARKMGLNRVPIVRKSLEVLNFWNRKPGYPKLDRETHRYLSNYFKPYNEELGKLIGLDLSAWNK